MPTIPFGLFSAPPPFVPPVGTTTWDPTLVYGGTHVYSGGDLVDTIGASANQSAKALLGKSTGKWVWEETLTQKVTGRQYAMGMLAAIANPAAGQPGSANGGFGYQSTDATGSGIIRVTGVNVITGLAGVDQGDTVQCYWDGDTAAFSFYVNYVLQGSGFSDFPGEVHTPGHATNGFPTTILTANFGAVSSGLQALAASLGANAGIYP